jgi:hypothetical protein
MEVLTQVPWTRQRDLEPGSGLISSMKVLMLNSARLTLTTGQIASFACPPHAKGIA